MATSIQAPGIDRRQAEATLEASQQALYERIKDTAHQRHGASKTWRIKNMRAEQRAGSSTLFNLMLAMALGMAGVAGGWLFGQFF